MAPGRVILARSPRNGITATDEHGAVEAVGDLPAFLKEHAETRVVWDDTARWYPPLLQQRVRVDRCYDLRLSHNILRHSALTADSALARAPASSWDEPFEAPSAPDGLFQLAEPVELDVASEFASQQEAIDASAEPGRIRRLIAAESAGALVAAEMNHAGLPWDARVHDGLLTELLGPRPQPGERPRVLADLAERLRELLEAPDLNPDSQPNLLRALERAGLRVSSTARWELRRLEHPAIAPLLQYKKLARLLSANGWHWLDTWVHDGRFRANFVPGAVVTGRWGSDGGGALQLPKEIRAAGVADPGWKLVVADASQLEPRVLAAMARDERLAAAGEGDLYEGIVRSGAVTRRDEAKVAMLAAMYGATSGDAGRLMPRLARAYPRAIRLVEEAARAGERGEVVTTTLGRSSPPPGSAWRGAQAAAFDEQADVADAARARGQARAWGRFTRNFVVQGSAAEWALCWMAGVRGRLHEIAGPRWLTEGPHLVFFLHDELVVHCPEADAAAVVEALHSAAADAGRLLFGATPVTFPLTVAVVDDYARAK